MANPTEHTILVVEDDIDLLKEVTIRLASQGYKVVTSHHGRDALDRVHTIKPSLIILDLYLPIMSGTEFFREIVNKDGTTQYPVFIFSGLDHLKKVFMEFSIAGFMTKPYAMHDMIQEVNLAIDKFAPKREVYQNASVVVIDDKIESLHQISETFRVKNYSVDAQDSTMNGIMRCTTAPLPDIALIKATLEEIPGHIVAQRLNDMNKSSHIKKIVYAFQEEGLLENKKEQIKCTHGVDSFIEIIKPSELIPVVEGMEIVIKEEFKKKQEGRDLKFKFK